jgi:uncharacterized protein (TIGR00369 family)
MTEAKGLPLTTMVKGLLTVPSAPERFFRIAQIAAADHAVSAALLTPSAPADLTELLGARPDIAEGSARLALVVTRELVNPLGQLHGGITLCVSDLLAQAALQAEGGPSRTVSVHVAYPRPILEGATARFSGQVVHRGRTFAVVRVTAHNAAGKPCAIATVTTGMPA